MTKWTVISSDDEFVNFSALLDGNEYYGVSLNFDAGDGQEVWDDEQYLVKELYPYLNSDDSHEEFDLLFGDRKAEMLEMFDEALKLGFL